MPTNYFEKGNRLWELCPPDLMGRPRLIETPEVLVEKIVAYFEWADANPIVKDNIGWYEGQASHEETVSPRAMTVVGCCAHMGVDRQLWYEWRRNRPDLLPVLRWAEDIMYEQKFSGAAAGVLNPMIICRELGLADKNELTSPDGSLTPKPTVIEFVAPQLTADEQG